MESILAERGRWFEAQSTKVLANVLHSRRGGSISAWESEVDNAFRVGQLIAEKRGGKMGYRTLSQAEDEQRSARFANQVPGSVQRTMVNA